MPVASRTPDQRTVRVLVVALGVVLLGISTLLSLTSARAGPERLVYVSGRDDHGLLAAEAVAVHAQPDGAVTGRLADGSIARAVGSRGSWIRLQPVDGTAGGWVNDFFLRGRLHLVDPAAPACAVTTSAAPGGPPRFQLPASRQIQMYGVAAVDGDVWVAIRPDEEHDLSWVPIGHLSELPGPDPRGVDDVSCDELPWPEPVHRH